MNILRLEVKKIWQTPRTGLFLVIGLLLVIVLFIFNRYQTHQENLLIFASDDPKDNLLDQQKFDTTIKDYLLTLNLTIEEQEAGFRTAADKGTLDESSLTLPTYPFYRMALNEELIQRELPPYSLRYGTKSNIFSSILLSYLASLAGIIFLLLAFGDSLSSELESRQLYFYLSQPVKRTRLLLTKYLVVLLHAGGFSLLILGFGWIIAAIFSGTVTLDYPIIVFTDRSMKLIPLAHYLSQVGALFLMTLAFALALHFLISLFTQKTYFALLLTITALFEGNAVSTMNIDWLNKIAHLNPFTYLNAAKIFIGYDFRPFQQYNIENQEYYANYCLPRILHNDQITLNSGLLVLGCGTLLLLFLCHLALKRNAFQTFFT